jgi:prepilin-type N-terminal cleavage/methylation domain-containing protein
MNAKLLARPLHRPSQAGMSLIETMIALSILLVVSVGILSMGTVAMSMTENQGHLAARTAEYAQDKMEQLMSLAYGDPTTDTTAFPPTATGGSGLTIGGSSDPSTPVTTPGTGYVDYLDISGQPVSSTGNWFYIRVWQISNPIAIAHIALGLTSRPGESRLPPGSGSRSLRDPPESPGRIHPRRSDS